MATRKRTRPRSARDTGDRLKLHRRVLWADGREYTVISLRPDARVRFSTNRYHETWHILSDDHGARVLGRLLWGLSFQRRPGTIVVIGPPHLDPNPFDAEPATPIALVHADLTVLTPEAARRLRHLLTAPAKPDGTVRWHAWGLDQEAARFHRFRETGEWPAWEPRPDDRRSAVERIGGMLVLRGLPKRLREWAVYVAMLDSGRRDGMDYVYLETNWPIGPTDGEVQIFRNYRQRVSVATVSRREILGDADTARLPPEQINERIWAYNSLVRARRHRKRARALACS